VSLPESLLTLLEAVKGKRARIVVDHIREHGFITTEDLEKVYGYKHPPRALRDVREQGIPLESFRVKNAEGRSIAAYRFADSTQIRSDKIGGRRIFTKAFKKSLLAMSDSKCAVCLQLYDGRYLQIDHRVPYEVSGDLTIGTQTEDYMLLCGSCNRAKSWSCEHCDNWRNTKDPALCKTCYWANPQEYQHIALKQIRRLDLIWEGDEVANYEQFIHAANLQNLSPTDYLKQLIKQITRED